MAIIATSQVVYDGTRNVSLLLTGICDGQDGNETVTLKVDVNSFIPVGYKVKVTRISYDIGFGVVKLSWEANPANVDFIVLNGPNGKFNFRSFDGVPNGGGDTATGNILLTTIGFELNSSYSILLEMVKKP